VISLSNTNESLYALKRIWLPRNETAVDNYTVYGFSVAAKQTGRKESGRK